ncbi:UNVERIFIED_CONTAM: Retrovirus-related Pol polyprotein from transposon TNT 1-94 [Sesamum latifolium]|uniref:Retrovirus-related Pol polyprotein from transposon TNT 1-94 n=1 Tax=Sesamum latifolium TaxID=2727402 RepID=A0AAW2XIK0_9LAMI
MISRESNLWYDAMKEEMNSMAFNKVWDLVELSDGFKTIGCKWVFKTKKDSLGNIERHKATLVAKGFTQKEEIDYTKTFSPVSKKDSLCTIMTLVAHFDMDLNQMDVKTTFLNGELEEEVYMKQPEGFSSSNENIMDQCIYQKVSGSRTYFLVLYVDDILLATNDKASRFIEIDLDASQETYINKVLERFRMKDCSPSVAPIVKGDKLHLNQCPRNDLEREQMKDIPYASAIESLMYAQVCTRPDIAFAGDVGKISERTENMEVVGYLDSDFAGCVDSRKSTSGYIFMIASGAVSWRSAKQTLIATSTMEAQLHTGLVEEFHIRS